MAETCPDCGTTVADPLHELVDEDGNVEEELWACPSCGNDWSKEV